MRVDRRIPSARPLETFVRWGWFPLVLGCVLIAVAMFVGSELAFARLGYAERDVARRALFVTRDAVTSLLLAAWVGWYVIHSRRVIERARANVLERERELEQAAGLGACARIVAHEIRNPLNALAIHSELAKRHARRAADPELEGAIDAVHRETQRLKSVLDGYASCVDAIECDARRTGDLAEVVRRAVANDPAHDRIVVEASRECPHVMIDEAKMTEALRRLIAQANESSTAGSITVRLRRDGGSVAISVHEEGARFRDPSSVFGPFPTDGSSFAFAIVRDIARAHGGEVHARNDADGRTTIMSIPVAA